MIKGFSLLCLSLLGAVGMYAQTAPNDSISQQVQLHDVEVTGRTNQKLISPTLGGFVLDKSTIKNVPTVFGESDIIKSLQLQPGVSAGTEGFAGMYVRGGGNDENAFLVDGVPIYQVNHLGGLFSPFNVEAIDKVSFYKGTFPASYGGRLSSVVDITSKTGDFYDYHGNISVGLTSANIAIDGPLSKGRTSVSAAIRRSWLELIALPSLAILNHANRQSGVKTIGGYSFTDVNLNLTHRLGRFGELSLLGYISNDRLKIGEHNFSNDRSLTKTYYYRLDENRMRWGNAFASLQWHAYLFPKLRYDILLSAVDYSTRYEHEFENTWGKKEEEGYQYDYSRRVTVNGITDMSASVAFTLSINEVNKLKWGLRYTRHFYSPESDILNMEKDGDIIIEDQNPKVTANEYCAYADLDLKPVDALIFNTGLRFSSFVVGSRHHNIIEPRVSFNCMLSTALSVKFGYAKMSQISQQVSDNYLSLPTDSWVPIYGNQKPMVSDQVSGGIYMCLDQGRYVFTVEGYYKWMDNLLEYRDGYRHLGSNVEWVDRLASGRGYAYGAELLLERTYGKFTGFLGYGLLWSYRRFPDLNGGRRFPSKFDNRHKINISLNYKVSDKVEINGGWTYMTGNRITLSTQNYQYAEGWPTTMVPTLPMRDTDLLEYYDEKNNVRLPAYHRLDMGINIYRPKKNGRMGIWNISVYNAYSRMNPIIIQKSDAISDFNGAELNPRFRKLSLFPLIPSISYSYRF